ncbi:MAG: hypothetical protein C6P37_03125 [Caldibacillus debilis]|uniref:Uncharacterized protein n=1 Tax=Caldibacillus debilis TaxID=301148 RepID=A0A3E0K7Q1_9BACI|nr:MAG: hypothetical protein C6P37_03125 [Caldibacillus debilis]
MRLPGWRPGWQGCRAPYAHGRTDDDQDTVAGRKGSARYHRTANRKISNCGDRQGRSLSPVDPPMKSRHSCKKEGGAKPFLFRGAVLPWH